ncbi:MAG TPA: tRNA-dihydrouridine synthase [Candidatus Paceibacterota bacterium]|nr:tRNA-dihydrouridine synthase [Candidatus Paceibacterota bacterium]
MIWDKNSKPFFALAPMADVTDPAYRKLIAASSKGLPTSIPYITWTEFVSADGLYHTREKKGMLDAENPLVRDLLYTEGERPVIAQFFTSRPEMMEYAAALAVELGFDGVDINMGCPDRSIEKQGAGAAHIKDPQTAKRVIEAALQGTGGKIPVSVKTRLGFNTIEYDTWLPHLLETGISALTLHMRTRKEMSKVAAHWELGAEIVSFCKKHRPDLPILGNGDLVSVQDAESRVLSQGFDGAMLGRAIFGNPWLFSGRDLETVTPAERIEALLTLARSFSTLAPQKHFSILKKHFKAFISGWDGAAELRARLMVINSLEELETVLGEYDSANQ